MKKSSTKIVVSESIGSVSAEIMMPKEKDARAVLVLAHGAGAGMKHKFMTELSKELVSLNIGTVRFNFPFAESKKGRPDVPAVAEKTIEAALQKVNALYPDLPLFAAGKSFGGRMSSHYLSKYNPDFVKGLIFYGFPLHAPGKESTERADHLKEVKVPMLFLQGTRDSLAKMELIKKVTRKLKLATLVKFEKADHSFKSGKKDFIPELAKTTSDWLDEL